MRHYRFTGSVFLFSLAFGSLILASSGEALSYFTTYAQAKGGRALILEEKTDLDEEVISDEDSLRKEVRVRNTGETDCYIRVKVFAGSQVGQVQNSSMVSTAGENWREAEDGFWYYESIVPAGGETEKLTVRITLPSEENREYLEIRNFDVIVVEECTQVRYDAAGNAYADWNAVQAEEEGEGE